MSSSTATTGASGRVRLWVRATRPPYLLTSVVPALAGALVGVEDAPTSWALVPVVLLAVLLVHAGTNACNDCEDFASGVDQPDKVENSGVFTSGALGVAEGRRLYAALFGAALALGLLLAVLQTPWVLAYAVLGLLGGWLYTGGPVPFKHVGLGDPLIVLLMGPLLTQGACTAVTGAAFDAGAFGAGFVPGFLIAAVLQANNAADVGDDRRAGLRTVAVRVGEPWASRAIAVSLALAVVAPVVLVLAGATGPSLLVVLLVVPLLVPLGRAAVAASHVPATDGETGPTGVLIPRIAQAHMAASALLVVAVLLDRAL